MVHTETVGLIGELLQTIFGINSPMFQTVTYSYSTSPEQFAGILFGSVCIFWILISVVWIAISIWVYKDAKKRGENAVLWLLIVLVTGIIGLIIWLIVRDSHEKEAKRYCPSCGRSIPNDARICPYCRRELE